MEKSHYLYDVFISHAVEDKIPIANELCRRLEEKKLKVWYSGNELSVGDRLTESIHKSLDQCRFGVVIISPTYLSKIWALSEFFFLLTKEKNGQKVILPVLYDITPQQLAARSTLMAEMFAVRADRGMDHITEKLYSEIQKQLAKDTAMVQAATHFSISKKKVAIGLAALLVVVAGAVTMRAYFQKSPGRDVIEQVIQERISEVQQQAIHDLQDMIKSSNAKVASVEDIKSAYLYFLNSKTLYSDNGYTLYTSLQTFHTKRHVNEALSLNVDTLTPLNLYKLAAPDIYRALMISKSYREEKLLFYSSEGVKFHVEESDDQAGHHNALVHYENPIRMVSTTLIVPESANVKRQQVAITALRPTERYTFINKEGQWMLESTE